MKVYNEVGLNWGWGLMSYEIEYGDGSEERFKGWYRGKIIRIYLRIWLGSKCVVISNEKVEVVNKGRFNVKFILGFEME